MIAEFLETWDLFAASYLSAWLIAALLGLLGTFVLARDQIFLGAALSQASALGVIAAGSFGGFFHLHAHGPDDPAHGAPCLEETLAAVGAAVGALLFIRWLSGRRSQTAESLTGWVFLASSAGAMLLAAGDPRSTELLQRLSVSSLIGATWTDVGIFAALVLIVGTVLITHHRQLLLSAIDPVSAQVQGIASGRWRLVLDLGLAAGIALSLRSAGTLYTFACLILPAMIARNLCRRTGPMLGLAPVIGVGLAIAGCIVANDRDWPPAQTAVAFMAAAWLPAALWNLRKN